MSYEHFNAHRNMWVMVLFDLPTETKKERKAAANYRKTIWANGNFYVTKESLEEPPQQLELF